MAWKIGVDIGGTFTDICAVGDEGVFLWKVDSTPKRLAEGVQTGLGGLAEQLGSGLGELLGDTEVFVHGSTVATNALIQRTGPVTALICTKGFRDVLYFRDGFKWDRYNFALPRPQDLVPRYLRVGVPERIAFDGSVQQQLDEGAVRMTAAFLQESGVEVVAVALLWSHVNSTHERRVREIMSEELPGVPVILSCETLPEIGEWVRTSATVLSAYVYQQTAAYLAELQEWLRANGLQRDLLVMQLNGGCARASQALRIPVNLIRSGPAATPAAARQIARRIAASDVIAVDMGGTSFDVCLMRGGEVPLSRRAFTAHQPLGVSAVEVESIGAGGGSIAWVDPGGVLRVGPQSAGAVPGPACYGAGGSRPTVTDANIVLGYLPTDAFLGGRRTLRRDLAEQAIQEYVADPLGLASVHQAAAGIIRIVDDNMASAIRAVTIERGIDPRPCVIISGGGAGSLHAGRLAAIMGISRVVVPSQAGTLSAFGMTVASVRHEYSGTLHTTTRLPNWDGVDGLLRDLEDRAVAEVERSGFSPRDIRIERTVDGRYIGQFHELTCPVPDGEMTDLGGHGLRRIFDELHRERYTYDLPESPVEFLHWRVAGVGALSRPSVEQFAEIRTHGAPPSPNGSRSAYLPEYGAFIEMPIFDSATIRRGARFEGPAIVESATTTILILPGQTVFADGKQNYLIETEAD